MRNLLFGVPYAGQKHEHKLQPQLLRLSHSKHQKQQQQQPKQLHFFIALQKTFEIEKFEVNFIPNWCWTFDKFPYCVNHREIFCNPHIARRALAFLRLFTFYANPGSQKNLHKLTQDDWHLR